MSRAKINTAQFVADVTALESQLEVLLRQYQTTVRTQDRVGTLRDLAVHMANLHNAILNCDVPWVGLVDQRKDQGCIML